MSKEISRDTCEAKHEAVDARIGQVQTTMNTRIDAAIQISHAEVGALKQTIISTGAVITIVLTIVTFALKFWRP